MAEVPGAVGHGQSLLSPCLARTRCSVSESGSEGRLQPVLVPGRPWVPGRRETGTLQGRAAVLVPCRGSVPGAAAAVQRSRRGKEAARECGVPERPYPSRRTSPPRGLWAGSRGCSVRAGGWGAAPDTGSARGGPGRRERLSAARHSPAPQRSDGRTGGRTLPLAAV